MGTLSVGTIRIDEAVNVYLIFYSKPFPIQHFLDQCCDNINVFIAGYVNTLLSWPGIIPLSRLTYAAYLVHPIILFYYNFSLNETIFFNEVIFVSINRCLLFYVVEGCGSQWIKFWWCVAVLYFGPVYNQFWSRRSPCF